MVRRCLRVAVVDDATSHQEGVGATDVMMVRASKVGASSSELNRAAGARAMQERLRRTRDGDALLILTELFMRLRDEGRNAKSRGDAENAAELAALCDDAARMGAACLDEPGAFGPSSARARETLASSLLGSSSAAHLAPEFLGTLLKSVSDDKLGAVVSHVVDALVEQLKKPTADEATVSAACAALVSVLSYAGKGRAGAALAAHPMFVVSVELPPPAAARAPQRGQLAAFLAAMTQMVAADAGAAFEANTALGLVLRVAGVGAADADARADLQRLLRRADAAEARMRELGLRVAVARDASEALGHALVKNGAASRDALVRWLCALLARSPDAEASRLDATKVPSATTRLNACSLLLRLCRPIVGNVDREANARADLAFHTQSDLGRAIFPEALTKVHSAASADADMADAGDSDDEMYDDGAGDDEELRKALAMSTAAPAEAFNFVTTVLAVAGRALRLGLVCELRRHDEEQDHLMHVASRVGLDDPRVQQGWAASLAAEVGLLHEALVDDALNYSAYSCRWLLRLSPADFRAAPEHLLEDCALLPALVAKFRPDALRRAAPLAAFVNLAAKCLGARDALVKSPHLRDKLVQALHACCLPREAQASGTQRGARPGAPDAASPANVALLLDANVTASGLAPSLLWMFGDAEHLGFYDISPARLRIAALIRQLWASPLHRESFRTLANERGAFVTFANGLLNETNRLVASAMEKLPVIRDHQARTGVLASAGDAALEALRAEYLAAAEARRTELDERFTEAERVVTHELRLCTETLGLVELLTGDAAVSAAFCIPELRSRLANALMSVMRAFTGARSLAIKVEQAEKYGFDPRDILTRVGRIATHFAHQAAGEAQAFAAALAASGYYEAELLPRTVATLRRLRTLDAAAADALDILVSAVRAAAEVLAVDDGLEDGAPEHFVDPLVYTLMSDPVKLPSGHVIDSTTIKQHLLNEQTDPFTRQPLALADLVSQDALRDEIQQWLAAKRAERCAAVAAQAP
ncbi:ubiquitin elongating factor core-domain-containing protein [Pelagophyceae sp. CCMP2097]|nr:ubiquitin elongating factor core-domain-containing protein [Pelagophyceae sp. CCMP2097]